MYRTANDLRHADTNVREAARFCIAVAAIGVAFLVVATVWVSTCHGSTIDTAACGAPQRAALAIGAPAILLFGGLRAFFRSYQTWRKHEVWWAWQGVGWLLMTLALLALKMSVPAVAGFAMFGG